MTARPRRVVFVVFDGVQILDVTGPLEVFSQANRATDRDVYATELVAPRDLELQASNGLRLLANVTADGCRGPIDTLVAAGGVGVRAASRDEPLVAWLRMAARRSRRVCSVCTGAFLLARAGLLDGRRATTHWAACAALARVHPIVEVEPDPIFVRDGNVYTSAGVTAGIDLALALVEEDLGAKASLDIARALVLFMRRPGGQAQFSAALAAQPAARPGLREVQEWIGDHVADDLSVAALAHRCHMSPRHFARVFAHEVGLTPAAYVESIRLERSRALLETTDLQLDEIARRCGFGTVETMRRAFGRRLHTSPSEYRSRFQNVIPIPRRAAS